MQQAHENQAAATSELFSDCALQTRTGQPNHWFPLSTWLSRLEILLQGVFCSSQVWGTSVYAQLALTGEKRTHIVRYAHTCGSKGTRKEPCKIGRCDQVLGLRVLRPTPSCFGFSPQKFSWPFAVYFEHSLCRSSKGSFSSEDATTFFLGFSTPRRTTER